VGVAFLILPTYGTYCKSDKANDYYCAAYEMAVSLGDFVDAHDGAFTAFATVAIAWFTFILKRSTDKLWDAGERQLAHSEDTARRQLRAYIAAPVQSEVRHFPLRTLSILGFKNSGQTPAHDVSVWATSAVAVYPLEERPTAPARTVGEGASVGVVGPSEPFHCEFDPEAPVTKDEWEQVVAGKCAFFLYGELSYRDAFGKQHLTTFCRFYRGDAARSPNGSLATYHKWNEAD
jgi:hypothetical protein